MIQEIEEFRPELQVHALGDCEQLVRREVDVERARPDEYISAGVSESIRLGNSERAGREPLRQLCAGWSLRIVRL